MEIWDIIQLTAAILAIIVFIWNSCKVILSWMRAHRCVIQDRVKMFATSIAGHKRYIAVRAALAYGVGATVAYTSTNGVGGDAPLWVTAWFWTIAIVVWGYAVWLASCAVYRVGQGIGKILP